MKKLLILPIILLFLGCTQNNSENDNTKINSKVMNRVEELLSKMTVQEKIAQLNLVTSKTDDNRHVDIEELVKKGLVGNILKSNGAAENYKLQKIAVEESRLGIPILFQEDVIHGYKTIFPMPMAEASSWNLDGIKKTAQVAAKEAAASGISLTYAPMVDIGRDPRWGRIVEAAGEDPYLASLIAEARVKGFQGDDLSDSSTIMACVKHFIGYGDALAGRDYNIGDFSEREMRETYLPPFKAAINAGVGSLMASYTAIDGVPATANEKIMKHLLRNELRFEGMVITDWKTISNLVKTGVATNAMDASYQAMKAEIDVDMVSEAYVQHLESLVSNGSISVESIDKAVARVLKAKFDLGLFDDPYKYMDTVREKQVQLTPEHLQIAREAAQESMVLLKNENNVLPLSKNIKSIAVIGPMAKSQHDLMSWWGGNFSQGKADDVVSLYEGIKAAVSPNTEVLYAQGVILNGFQKKGLELIPEAIETVKKADVVILAIGEEYWMSGEGGSVSSLDFPGAQNELIDALMATNKPIVTVLLNGRPYDIRKPAEHFDAILEAWFPGTMGGHAIADVLFGDFNPCGKLPVTYPLCTGQIPIYYNYRRTSHDFEGINTTDRFLNNYLDIPTKPLYPFGYGLSYTTYEYSNLNLQYNGTGNPIVSIEVTNTGKRAGFEVVQLYIQDVVTSVATPALNLKGFERIHLEPSETKTVTFEITRDKLTFIGRDLKDTFEPGEFKFMVGNSSVDLMEVACIIE